MDGAAIFGNDLFGEPLKQPSRGALADRFMFPPFSVLNAREGAWQERKRAWIGMGIESEVGRGNALLKLSETIHREKEVAGTSIFDPVLCELAYQWFCPDGGQIVDPFAGGSVRGIVAGMMGYKYHGIDLRPEQTEANEAQRLAIVPEADVEWRTGDSIDLMESAPESDFIMSCPPYGDLERYSDDPLDLSTMEYHTFLAAYKRIILRCFKCLKPNRLACFVVGDFRDKRTGMYRGFVADTINAFREVGMPLYNDAILVTSVGSLPIRVSGQFDAGRKLGKTHQNILVFAKGDPTKAFKGESE